MKKRRHRRNRMKNDNNYIYIFVIVIIFVIGLSIIKFGLDFKIKVNPVYSFTAQKNSNYEVLLNPNTFYTAEALPSGGYYASKSIKSFIINFTYDFKADKKENIEYNYSIMANLIGTVNDNQDKEVWNRDFIISENNVNMQENIDKFLINEQVNIDYEYYNNLVNSYEETYGIKIDAVLKIYFKISYNIDNTEDYIELDIPITNTVTQVTENYEKITNKQIMPELKNVQNIKLIYYIVGSLFIVGGITLCILKITKNKMTPEEMYNHNIKRILKYYKDLIVTVTNEPNVKNLEVMNISVLDDLIDVAEQNQSNIIHYEVIPNEESNLYVIVNKYVYVYTVTSNKLK